MVRREWEANEWFQTLSQRENENVLFLANERETHRDVFRSSRCVMVTSTIQSTERQAQGRMLLVFFLFFLGKFFAF